MLKPGIGVPRLVLNGLFEAGIRMLFAFVCFCFCSVLGRNSLRRNETVWKDVTAGVCGWDLVGHANDQSEVVEKGKYHKSAGAGHVERRYGSNSEASQ